MALSACVPVCLVLKPVSHFAGANPTLSGADVVFRSFLAPMLSKYFVGSGSTASNLRAKAEGLSKDE